MRITHLIAGLLIAAAFASGQTAAAQTAPHNVVIFVADGLRARSVNDATAPNMAALAREGVALVNSHSLFPTFTTANASAMATGHYLGDTGDFSNTIYTGFSSEAAGDTVVPFLENDAVLADVDKHFGGNYLNEETLLAIARAGVVAARRRFGRQVGFGQGILHLLRKRHTGLATGGIIDDDGMKA